MTNLAAQYIAVAMAVGIAVVWIVRRILRRRSRGAADCHTPSPDGSACPGCPLSSRCSSKR